ncbi:hypothetical protein HD597_009351 [Nonomuraea thailandensis]|uniref:Uncharacterized protein n=1 Tax=Nonomuraea thailandensis TaxID=1188745 RepID=A0A9X2GNQ6_9ACTN|nr:hypothetical protein [Nonomuraea thailandensis]MCP2362331.1 hypothetical protein [Nonomuraea thailandensis]
MPSHVSRENAIHLTGPVPTLALVSAEPVEQLPELELRSGEPSVCVGWQLLTALAFSVVDGPGDAGFLVDGLVSPDEVEERFGWLRAVDRAGGAVVVVAGSREQARDWSAVAGSGGARGGFVALRERDEGEDQ